MGKYIIKLFQFKKRKKKEKEKDIQTSPDNGDLDALAPLADAMGLMELIDGLVPAP